MTIAERLMRVLAPFIGSGNCQENREKICSLIKEELPQFEDEEISAAVDYIWPVGPG